MNRVIGVIRNNRAGGNEFQSFVQNEDESLREFVHKVRSTCSLVFTNRDVDEQNEPLRDRFLEGLRDPEILETLLRGEARS